MTGYGHFRHLTNTNERQVHTEKGRLGGDSEQWQALFDQPV